MKTYMVDGIEVYVVEFDTMPELPIYSEEARARKFFDRLMPVGTLGYFARLNRKPSDEEEVAHALTESIKNGTITEPGKYGIGLEHETNSYSVYKIIE